MKKESKVILAIIFALVLALFFARLIKAAPIRVAVLACKNNASASYSDFARGIPDMLMTGLSKCKDFEVVERIQIDNALKSMALEQRLIDNRRGK